jgi:hypothetical protein
MELKEFIKKTIEEIIEGVNGIENNTQIKIKHSLETYTIGFEVLLTEASDTESKSGIGVFLSSVGIGTNNRTNEQSTSFTKINFSVPINY